jgi:Ran GTPase-activating protein (RanGAP) involved in mRNA processing and transport
MWPPEAKAAALVDRGATGKAVAWPETTNLAMCMDSEAELVNLLQNTPWPTFALVRKLDLSGNRIAVRGARAIAHALKSSLAGLTHLTLRDNCIGNEAARALVNEDVVLVSLGLAANQIGVDGTRALACVLGDNAVLTFLDLSENEIKDEGATALGQALRANRTLRELRLRGCAIGPEGGKALAAALSQGNAVALAKLDAHCNELGEEGRKTLRDAAAGRRGFELIT